MSNSSLGCRHATYLGVQRLHDLAHLLQCLDRRTVCILQRSSFVSAYAETERRGETTYISFRLIEHQKTSPTLIEHAVEYLVEDHLGESVPLSVRVLDGVQRKVDSLGFDSLPLLTHQLGHMCNLDTGVGLDDAEEVLFEEVIVEGGEVGADCWVG